MTELDPGVGTIVRSEIDPETGEPVAKVLPWTESDTTYGGVGTSAIKQRDHAPAVIEKSEPVRKRTPAERALQLVGMFMAHLENKRSQAGRPLVVDDFSDMELATFGLDRRSAEALIDNTISQEEFFRRLAGVYLEATSRGSDKDARWTPGRI